MVKKFYRTNQYIRALQLRVIGPDGKQIGILPLQEALLKAQETSLDLVEIVPTAKPPVAKIVNFKKFLYQEDKKEREAKKKTRGGEVKGIRVAPFIAKADLDFRVKRAEGFLKEGNKVRVAVRFQGRQLGKREFGYEILKKFTEALAHCSQIEGLSKWMGKELILTLSPIKGQSAGRQGGKNVKETQDKEIISQEI